MLQIDNTLISLDIIDKKFICNLTECRGECCVSGDSGAPLTAQECTILEQQYPNIKPYMRPEGIKAIEQHGVFTIDWENEPVTTLIDDQECAFVVFENGIAKCAIEKAFRNQKTTFPKPLSCHLYPIRIKKLDELEALNYDQWSICSAAVTLGKKEDVPIYKFLREPLIRKYGQQWYQQLEYAAENRDKIPD